MTRRILFVDDEGAILRALSRQLSIRYDISTAYSADEALNLLDGPGKFDVVVSDVSMPGMNGLDMIENASQKYPDCQFVVLTGNADFDTLTRAKTMPPVCEVLHKPCKTEQIHQAIERAAELSMEESLATGLKVKS
jgi:two-component system response regulator YesN